MFNIEKEICIVPVFTFYKKSVSLNCLSFLSVTLRTYHFMTDRGRRHSCEVWVTPQGKLEGCTVISRLFIMRNHTTNYLTLQSTGAGSALEPPRLLRRVFFYFCLSSVPPFCLISFIISS